MSDERKWLPISASEYHALEALGSSAVKCFAQDGQLEFYARYIERKKEREDTDAMRMGRAFHAAMEGRNDWENRYKRIPTCVEDDEFVEGINGALGEKSKAVRLKPGDGLNLQQKTHREYFEAHRLRAEREGKDFITDDELDIVRRQVEAVFDNPKCREVLTENTGLLSEVACLWEHSSGLKLKALLDRVVDDGFVDFKKTRFTRIADFYFKDIEGRGYDFQLAHYSIVTGKLRCGLISVNDTYPFEANLWFLPKGKLQVLTDSVNFQLEAIAQLSRQSCLDDDKDSQGIPLSYHNELWGAAIPMDRDELFGNKNQ